MADLKESKPNRYMAALATALRTGREALNTPGKLPESWPVVGGMGAGDLFFGKAPEAMEDWSYPGGSPIKGGPTLQTFKTDPRVLDVAGAPVVGVGGLTKAAQVGRTALMSKLLKAGGENAGRREFLKQAGAIGGAAAVPSVVKLAANAAPSPAAATAAAVPEEALMANAVRAARVMGSPMAALEAAKSWALKNSRNFVEDMEWDLDPDLMHQTLDEAMGKPEIVDMIKEFGKDMSQDELDHFVRTALTFGQDSLDTIALAARDKIKAEFADRAKSLGIDPEEALKIQHEYRFRNAEMPEEWPQEMKDYLPTVTSRWSQYDSPLEQAGMAFIENPANREALQNLMLTGKVPEGLSPDQVWRVDMHSIFPEDHPLRKLSSEFHDIIGRKQEEYLDTLDDTPVRDDLPTNEELQQQHLQTQLQQKLFK